MRDKTYVYSENHVLEERPDYDEYKLQEQEGEYDLQLQFRVWGHVGRVNTPYLSCCFKDKEGNKIKANAFGGDGVYKPSKCNLNMRDEEDGTWFRCTFKKNRNNRVAWASAEKLETE